MKLDSWMDGYDFQLQNQTTAVKLDGWMYE